MGLGQPAGRWELRSRDRGVGGPTSLSLRAAGPAASYLHSFFLPAFNQLVYSFPFFRLGRGKKKSSTSAFSPGPHWTAWTTHRSLRAGLCDSSPRRCPHPHSPIRFSPPSVVDSSPPGAQKNRGVGGRAGTRRWPDCRLGRGLCTVWHM